MKFTPHQEQALDRGRHLAVTANAGSGKTRVLVERYARLLMSGVPPGEVVALTYTEKAASELKRKIADRIAAALLASAEPREQLRMEEIRDALPAAFIGTIHSFCLHLLREYPVEAGVDAGFTMLDGVDGAVLLHDATEEVLRAVLAGRDAGVSPGSLMELLRACGRRRILHILGALVAKRDLLERFTGRVYAQGDDALLAAWRSALEGAVRAVLEAPGLPGDLAMMVARSSSGSRADAEGQLALLRGEGDTAGRAAAFMRLRESIFTQAGGIRKSFLGAIPVTEEIARAAGRIAEAARRIAPLVVPPGNGPADEAHRALLADSRLLLSLARDVAAGFDRRKAEDARLDFDDLLLRMRLLLGNERVRAELAGRFRYVMVDEYQDTNTLQLEILLPLLGGLAAGNLFVVGDPKQSIYRFRDADVEVFERSRLAIAQAAGDESLLRLGESFRPLRDLLAFVNLLFGEIMGGGGTVTYDPLVRARVNDDPGGVEILLPFTEGGGTLPQEELIARRILGLAGGEATVYDGSEHPRTLTFRDIALLLRSRNRLEQFEQAFIRNGVPYVVSGGVGYFQTQDVYDIYNYLRFLLNPDDDVALAGILRAPFFAVSDAALFELARGRGGRTLWQALCDASVPARAFPALAHAREVLAHDIPLAGRLPAAELIARVIRRTGFTAALAGTARGPQAEANLGKLLEMARAYESRGFSSLYDFLGRLARLIEQEEKEGQAAIESRTDEVRIMTIHAAKGLEFPVVIVPDLQRPFRYDTEPYFDPDVGFGFTASKGTSPIAGFLREESRRKTVEEEARIFYVACTRARDRLLLCSDGPATRHRDSWLAWLVRACAAGGQALESGPLRFEVSTQRTDGAQTIEERHTLVVPVTRSLPVPSLPAASPVRRGGEVRVDIMPLAGHVRGEIYSASRIRTYSECPAKYFFRYVLGVPAGRGPFSPVEPEDFNDGEYPAELRGRVFHAVMERADELSAERSVIAAAVRDALARESPLAAGSSPALEEDVTELLLGVIGSTAWGEIRTGTDAKTEYSISAALGDDFMTGTIDRLYRSRDGLWTVLDYKTDTVGSSDVAHRAENYWAQLEFYAIMVCRLHDARAVRTRLLFAQHPDLLLENTLGAAEIAAAGESVGRIIALIKAGHFPPREPHCQGCPMHPLPCAPA